MSFRVTIFLAFTVYFPMTLLAATGDPYSGYSRPSPDQTEGVNLKSFGFMKYGKLKMLDPHLEFIRAYNVAPQQYKVNIMIF